MTTRKDYIDSFASVLGIHLTPGGQWVLTKTGKKAPHHEYSTHRKNNIAWDNTKHGNDNMAKHYLTQEQQLLVVDIDGEYMDYNPDNQEYTIPSLQLTLPRTFHTITSRSDKFHFYYNTSNTKQELPSRVTHILDTQVDTFTYGNMFEWHSFATAHSLHALPVADIPKSLVSLLLSLDLPLGAPSAVTPTTHIQRYNLITKFLNDEITTNKQWFAFFMNIFPQEYKPKGKRKITIEDYTLSYDLFNKIAVKLTSTAELDHHTHIVPALYKMLELFGINPLSEQSQRFLFKNILPSLPEHESLTQFSQDDDDMTFQEHLDQQHGTSTPIFKVVDKTVKFIEIDKDTQEPVPHNDNYLIDMKAAQALHPERNIVSEEGRVVGWDDNLPLVYYINDPYEPQYILDDKHQRHTINLYTPSKYMKEAQAYETVPTDNIIYKTLLSGVGPEYLPLVLNFHAQVIFGRSSLNMVLWMASLPTDLGGAGKSIASVEILSLIAGGSIQAINEKTAMSGWGDVTASSRLVSLEDMTDLGKKEWDIVYAMIKQQTSNSYKKLNMKGASIATKRVRVSLSGSSNHRPMLPPSDRRFLCLEPAHLRGVTDPLTKGESRRIGQILKSLDYEPEVQEYVDYLLHLYAQPLSDYMQEALFERTPQTIYRTKWVGDGATNTQNIIHALSTPKELLGIVKLQDDIDTTLMCDLLSMVVLAYSSTTGKSAVSYKWFMELLPLVVAERYKENIYSKHNLEKMLQVDFKNVGIIYANTWKGSKIVRDNWSEWPADGYSFRITPEQYKDYVDTIKQLRPKSLEGIKVEI